MPLHQKFKPPDERNSVLPLPLMMMMMIEKLYKFIDFVTKTTVCTTKTKEKSKYTTDYWAICKIRIDLAHFFSQSNNFRCGIYANIDHTINIIYIISNSDELIQNDFSSSFLNISIRYMFYHACYVIKSHLYRKKNVTSNQTAC